MFWIHSICHFLFYFLTTEGIFLSLIKSVWFSEFNQTLHAGQNFQNLFWFWPRFLTIQHFLSNFYFYFYFFTINIRYVYYAGIIDKYLVSTCGSLGSYILLGARHIFACLHLQWNACPRLLLKCSIFQLTRFRFIRLLSRYRISRNVASNSFMKTCRRWLNSAS